MLLLEEENVLDEILGWQDAEEAVLYLMQNFAKKRVANAQTLIEAVPGIVDAAIEKMAETVSMHTQASYWLMCQREMNIEQSSMYFASMVPVCMARFPAGNAEGGCKAEQEYFDLFLKLFTNKKVFSWEKDGSWANLCGYTKYLQLVEMQLSGGGRNGA